MSWAVEVCLHLDLFGIPNYRLKHATSNFQSRVVLNVNHGSLADIGPNGMHKLQISKSFVD
jgi:hypothetical protein